MKIKTAMLPLAALLALAACDMTAWRARQKVAENTPTVVTVTSDRTGREVYADTVYGFGGVVSDGDDVEFVGSDGEVEFPSATFTVRTRALPLSDRDLRVLLTPEEYAAYTGR